MRWDEAPKVFYIRPIRLWSCKKNWSILLNNTWELQETNYLKLKFWREGDPIRAKEIGSLPKEMEGEPKEIKQPKEIRSQQKEMEGEPKEIVNQSKEFLFKPWEYRGRGTEGDPIRAKEIGSLPKEMEGEPKEIVNLSKEIGSQQKEMEGEPKEIVN
jgi:hypothetical protein